MGDLLLYEPHAGGHQAEFLTWLVEAWSRRGASGRLTVVAPPDISAAGPGLAEACRAAGATLASTTPVPTDRAAALQALALGRARPLQDALSARDPARVLLMNFEPLMAPLAARLPLPGRARVSALSFRPTLHYARFETTPAPVRTRAERWAKARMVRAATRHPRFETLFSLDPTAVPALRGLCSNVRVEGVPDPVPPDAVTLARAAVRDRYGIEPARHLMVLAGTLDARKGAMVVAEALAALPDAAARRLAVLFAGRVDDAVSGPLRALVTRAQRETPAQVVLHDAFVAPDEIQAHVAAADTVLLLYNAEHVGSSGFLMRAAGAGVPVLCTADGLMGHLTRQHALGRTTALGPVAVAQAMALALDDTGLDPVRVSAFARAHTVDAFTDALLDPLLTD